MIPFHQRNCGKLCAVCYKPLALMKSNKGEPDRVDLKKATSLENSAALKSKWRAKFVFPLVSSVHFPTKFICGTCKSNIYKNKPGLKIHPFSSTNATTNYIKHSESIDDSGYHCLICDNFRKKPSDRDQTKLNIHAREIKDLNQNAKVYNNYPSPGDSSMPIKINAKRPVKKKTGITYYNKTSKPVSSTFGSKKSICLKCGQLRNQKNCQNN